VFDSAFAITSGFRIAFVDQQEFPVLLDDGLLLPPGNARINEEKALTLLHRNLKKLKGECTNKNGRFSL
jgi:hypothetical protein